MATTASGWPYVEPADHPVEFPVSSQALANMLDTRIPESTRLRYKVIAGKTTDSSGNIVITPAELGLTAIEGAVASILWLTAIDGNSPTFGVARVPTSSSVHVRIFAMNAPASGGTIKVMPAGITVTLYVIAWGT